MRRANFQFPEIFEYKFGRKPKNWSIDQLHDLYLKVKERSSKRGKIVLDIINKITTEIPQDNKTHLVYFYQTTNEKTHLRQYNLKWDHTYNTYSYGLNDPKLNNREERLDFVLANTRAFELGQEFYEANKLKDMAYKTMWIVKEIMWSEIEKKLKSIYTKNCPEKVLVISIGDFKYFVSVDNGYGYASYKLLDEYDGKVVNI